MTEKPLLSRKDAADAISVSVRKLDYLIASGVLGAIKIGKRTLVPLRNIQLLAKTGCSKGAERQ